MLNTFCKTSGFVIGRPSLKEWTGRVFYLSSSTHSKNDSHTRTMTLALLLISPSLSQLPAIATFPDQPALLNRHWPIAGMFAALLSLLLLPLLTRLLIVRIFSDYGYPTARSELVFFCLVTGSLRVFFPVAFIAGAAVNGRIFRQLAHGEIAWTRAVSRGRD
ncbi:hypothetical protein VTK56DRAFT_5206 [Thermocarpiscus australiensis]